MKFCWGLLFALSFVGDVHARTLVDRIVAEVNAEPILYSEVQAKIQRGQVVMVTEFPAGPDDPDFKRALNDEINFELIMQEIEKLELEVTDGEVEREINSFLESRNLTREGLDQALQQQGMSFERYREDFRNQMLLRKFQGRVISPLVKITDKDVEHYYLRKSGSTVDKINLTLRQIYIAIPDGASKVVVKSKLERARQVYDELKQGMDFAEAAKIYSDAANAKETGGLLPSSMKLSDLSEGIREAVKDLAVGKFTEPVEFAGGYYLFYVEKKDFGGNEDFDAKKRKLEFELRSQEIIAQTRRWLQQRRQKSKVRIID